MNYKGIMVNHISYMLVKKIDTIEFRKYPELVVASTKNNDENTAFGILFDYISGKNHSRKKIAMTSPVISSKKIPMTSPVFSKNECMAFSLPEKYSKETAPVPTHSEVSIDVIPKRILAVLRFSGKTNKKRIKKYTLKLQNRLDTENIKTTGDVFLLRYNSPFTPGFLRRNEVAIELANFDKKP